SLDDIHAPTSKKRNNSQSITPKSWEDWQQVDRSHETSLAAAYLSPRPGPLRTTSGSLSAAILLFNIFDLLPGHPARSSRVPGSTFSLWSRSTMNHDQVDLVSGGPTTLLSTFLIAHTTFDLVHGLLDKVQGQLAAALNVSTTRSVAGRLIEALMHRALIRGMQLPSGRLGAGTVAVTLKLIGKAGSFVCETAPTDIAKPPLYLRPESPNFPAVDAILVTHEKLGLIQASLGNSHRRDFGMMLAVMPRLPRDAHVDVDRLGEVIYCLVGTDPGCFAILFRTMQRTPSDIRTYPAPIQEKISSPCRLGWRSRWDAVSSKTPKTPTAT
ncbi:hypothetical protein B0H15DRAFT_606897, partial [Mycena belliarum]